MVVISRCDYFWQVRDYGLLFGDDKSGLPYFTPETDFQLDLVPRKPILFEHNEGGMDGPIGVVVAEERDGRGIVIYAFIFTSARRLYPDLERGKLAFSVGGFGALVKAENGVMVRYPIVEYSLTYSPRDYRLIGRNAPAQKVGSQTFAVKGDRLLDPAGRVVTVPYLRQLVVDGWKVSIVDQENRLPPIPGFGRIYFNS